MVMQTCRFDMPYFREKIELEQGSVTVWGYRVIQRLIIRSDPRLFVV